MSKKHLLKVLLITMIAVGLTAQQASAATLMLHWLSCENATENGPDEVFIHINGRHSNGSRIDLRVPGGGCWALNDDGNNRKVVNVPLWRGEIKPEECVTIFVAFMEEDHVRQTQYLQGQRNLVAQPQFYNLVCAAAAGKGRSGAQKDDVEWLAKAIEGLVEIIFGNPDDVLGVVEVTIYNNGGVIQSSCRAVDHSYPIHCAQWKKARPKAQLFKLRGNGSDEYTAVLEGM